MHDATKGWLSSPSSHSPGKKPLLINQRLERETGRSHLLDFFIQMVLRFTICSTKQHMQSQQRLGERLWSPRVGSPGFASPFLRLATSQAGFQLLLLFPVRDSPTHPCYSAGIGDLVRHRERVTASSQHSCGLVSSVQSFGRLFASFWSGNINLCSFLLGCHFPDHSTSSLSGQTLPQTKSVQPLTGEGDGLGRAEINRSRATCHTCLVCAVKVR